jgi:hypothetical protein
MLWMAKSSFSALIFDVEAEVIVTTVAVSALTSVVATSPSDVSVVALSPIVVGVESEAVVMVVTLPSIVGAGDDNTD